MIDEESKRILRSAHALIRHLRGKVSDRKFRLLSAASGRAVWHWLDDERSRNGVLLLEQLADGVVGPEQRVPAAAAAQAAADEVEKRWEGAVTREQVVDFGIRWWAARTVAQGLGEDAWRCSMQAVSSADTAQDWSANPEHAARPGDWATGGTLEWEAALAIEVLGNPFRPITVDSSWRTGTVIALAQTIYDDRAFDKMPILGDALEEAGCGTVELLEHCRGPRPHALGCWCLDAILEKK